MIEIIHIASAATDAAAQEGGGVLGTLGVDLKLLIAQLVNFSVVLFVFWKWVLAPIADRLKKRTDMIEKSLADAQSLEKEMKSFEKWKAEEMAEVRREATDILTASQTEAEKMRGRMLEETRVEEEKIRTEARLGIEADKDRILKEARKELGTLVVSATERVLKEKMEKESDKKIIEEALKSL